MNNLENKEAPEESGYGKVITGNGSTIAIADYVQANYKDNRLISVSTLEDGSYVLLVENPESSGRATSNQMWLSQESVIGLVGTIMLHMEAKGIDMEQLMRAAVNPGSSIIQYSMSDNLQKPFLEKQQDEQVDTSED
jgi:hypothetical protein